MLYNNIKKEQEKNVTILTQKRKNEFGFVSVNWNYRFYRISRALLMFSLVSCCNDSLRTDIQFQTQYLNYA